MRRLLAVCALALVPACTPFSPAQPGQPPVVTTTVTETVVPPSTAITTPAAPESPANKPTAAPSSNVPATKGAINVGKTAAHFASPSGRLWCYISASTALCHFPAGMKGKVPSPKKACPAPESDFEVTGVQVGKKGRYLCSNDLIAYPVKDNATWFAKTGFPWVKYNGHTLASLPYGKKLTAGQLVCASEKNGVTCANTATKSGFRISLAGVVLF